MSETEKVLNETIDNASQCQEDLQGCEGSESVQNKHKKWDKDWDISAKMDFIEKTNALCRDPRALSVSNAEKLRMLDESILRFKNGDYDDSFEGCEGVRLVPNTKEEREKILSIFAKHGFV